MSSSAVECDINGPGSMTVSRKYAKSLSISIAYNDINARVDHTKSSKHQQAQIIASIVAHSAAKTDTCYAESTNHKIKQHVNVSIYTATTD